MHGVQCIQIVQFAICLKPNAAKRVVLKYKILTETREKTRIQYFKNCAAVSSTAIDPGFPRGWQPIIWPIFPKNCMKIGAKGRGARLKFVYVYSSLKNSPGEINL